MSAEKLQQNLLAMYEKGIMHDVSIIAEGREIKCHRMMLAAQSNTFSQQLAAGGSMQIKVNHKYKVMNSLIKFMYFGGFHSQDLSAEEALDALLVAEEYQISALGPNDITPLIVSKLTVQNCLSILRHEGLMGREAIFLSVCKFVGEHFLTMLPSMEGQLLTIPREYLSLVLRETCQRVIGDADTEALVKFCLAHTQLESACDLLRETKQWRWGNPDQLSLLRAPVVEEASDGQEWRIEKVRAAMEQTPARIVVGEYFDWCIRLDYGAEGKLRIVYESAQPKEQGELCINRFPAAMFEWRVVYRGQNVFNEKPVFICFPENVQLHWSTTLPVNAGELSDDDSLAIMVTMAENPMLSLVLYYFSADLKTTVFSEDILNRLPHIEYRCLSSYSLVKTHAS
jgi:hypothetical protein